MLSGIRKTLFEGRSLGNISGRKFLRALMALGYRIKEAKAANRNGPLAPIHP